MTFQANVSRVIYKHPKIKEKTNKKKRQTEYPQFSVETVRQHFTVILLRALVQTDYIILKKVH